MENTKSTQMKVSAKEHEYSIFFKVLTSQSVYEFNVSLARDI